jgi:hypothetical protein
MSDDFNVWLSEAEKRFQKLGEALTQLRYIYEQKQADKTSVARKREEQEERNFRSALGNR